MVDEVLGEVVGSGVELVVGEGAVFPAQCGVVGVLGGVGVQVLEQGGGLGWGVGSVSLVEEGAGFLGIEQV
ncbi:hypothetical protein ACFWTE_29920, partial [Nocardiopsis sp. NPDC058631]|uniref:hypothetical protein n=1 Tax=Nocardiopsis sp. NPDC058631 TaxID=3346566 RepID=UPI003650CEDB